MVENQQTVAPSDDLMDLLNTNISPTESKEERTQRILKEEQAGEDYLKELEMAYNNDIPQQEEQPKTEPKEAEFEPVFEESVSGDDFIKQISDEHDQTIEAERNSYIAALAGSVVDSFLPPVSLGAYAIEQIFGMDISKGIMGQVGKVNKERDTLFSKDPDKNMILNGLPKLLSAIAFFTDNRKFKIAANSTYLLMPIVQNIMAKRGPLTYKDTTPGSHDIIQTLLNAMPLIVSCVAPLINMDRIKAEGTRMFNEAKDPKYLFNNNGTNMANSARGVANLLMPKSF